MKRTPEGDAFTAIVIKAIQLNGLLETAGDVLTQESGQTSARWRVLGGIDETPKTVAEIARSLHLSRQGIQRIADTLTREGLTEFVPNPSDRRADLLDLTKKGRKCLLMIQTNQKAWANEMGSRLTLRKLSEIERAFDALIAALCLPVVAP